MESHAKINVTASKQTYSQHYMPLRTTQVLDVAAAPVLQIQLNTVSHKCVLYSAADEPFPIAPEKQQDMSQLDHTNSKWILFVPLHSSCCVSVNTSGNTVSCIRSVQGQSLHA